MKRLSLLFLLGACTLTQKQAEAIRGELWQHDQIPMEVCLKVRELGTLGIWREVSCKGNTLIPDCRNGEETYEEFISYCSKRLPTFGAAEWVNITDWLKKATRPGK